MDVQIHAAQVGNQSKKVAGGIIRAHVNASSMNFLGRLGFDFLQAFGASSRYAELPAFGKQLQCEFFADSGSCADDECFWHCVICSESYFQKLCRKSYVKLAQMFAFLVKTTIKVIKGDHRIDGSAMLSL